MPTTPPLDGSNSAELSDDREFWTPAELAALLGLTSNAVTHHCRRLFPDHKGRYRFDHATALRVLRYVRKVSIKKL